MKMTSVVRSIMFVLAVMFSAATLTGCNEDTSTTQYVAPPTASQPPADVNCEVLPSSPARTVIAGQKDVEVLAFRCFKRDPFAYIPITQVVVDTTAASAYAVYPKIRFWDETAHANADQYWVSYDHEKISVDFLNSWMLQDGHIYRVLADVATNAPQNYTVSALRMGVQFRQMGHTISGNVAGPAITILTPGNLILPEVMGESGYVASAVQGGEQQFDFQISCPGAPNAFACFLDKTGVFVGGVGAMYTYITDPVSHQTYYDTSVTGGSQFEIPLGATLLMPGEVRTLTLHAIANGNGEMRVMFNDMDFQMNNIHLNPSVPVCGDTVMQGIGTCYSGP